MKKTKQLKKIGKKKKAKVTKQKGARAKKGTAIFSVIKDW